MLSDRSGSIPQMPDICVQSIPFVVIEKYSLQYGRVHIGVVVLEEQNPSEKIIVLGCL